MTIKDLRERLKANIAKIIAERDAMQAEVHNSAMSEKTKLNVLHLLDVQADSMMGPIHEALTVISQEMFGWADEQKQTEKAAEVTA